VRKSAQKKNLTPRAFDVLRYLIEHSHRVVEKPELFEQVWKERFVTDNALTRTVTEIRHALGDSADSPDTFQEAVNLDPEYALAYAGLADSYFALGSVGNHQRRSCRRRRRRRRERCSWMKIWPRATPHWDGC